MNKLSHDQQYAFNKFVNGENIFVTGPGGTGKTELIKHMVNYAKARDINIQVCALTGCAACLLNCEARTVHSFFGIGLAKGESTKIVAQSVAKKHVRKEINKTKILIVDEVSMMSLKIFEIIEEICRKSKNALHGNVFGGIQVVFTGDFFQLPPVGNAGDSYSEMFCFESELWGRVFKKENQIELTTMFRQKDPLYSSILSNIRKGFLGEEDYEVLKKCINRPLEGGEDAVVPTKLFAIKSKADYINNLMFSKIAEEANTFHKEILTDCTTYMEGGNSIPLEILLKCNRMTPKEKEYEIENMINSITGLKENLQLKRGTLVMCTRNLDLDRGICNGSQGVVVDFMETPTKKIPVVKFTNGVKMPINMYYWQSEEYPSIAVGQIPLIMAWAITIHKIQGATLSMAEMDIGRSIFEYGQIYVALSRVKSLDGLYLLGFHPTKVRANPKVIEFYRGLLPTPVKTEMSSPQAQTQTQIQPQNILAVSELEMDAFDKELMEIAERVERQQLGEEEFVVEKVEPNKEVKEIKKVKLDFDSYKFKETSSKTIYVNKK
jgi:ATP-dependent DNA helicase PIF1